MGSVTPASEPEQQHLVDRSARLLRLLEKSGEAVFLPSIVVGELLVPVPVEEQAEVLKRLREYFPVADFDVFAALQFARMRHGRPTAEALREFQQSNPNATRNELIADTMIVATALAHKATKIYTNDRGIRNLTDNRIEVVLLDDLDLPDEQLGLDMPDSGSGQ